MLTDLTSPTEPVSSKKNLFEAGDAWNQNAVSVTPSKVNRFTLSVIQSSNLLWASVQNLNFACVSWWMSKEKKIYRWSFHHFYRSKQRTFELLPNFIHHSWWIWKPQETFSPCICSSDRQMDLIDQGRFYICIFCMFKGRYRIKTIIWGTWNRYYSRWTIYRVMMDVSSFLSQDADGLKVGVAGLINQWVKGSEDGSRCSSPSKPAVSQIFTLIDQDYMKPVSFLHYLTVLLCIGQ